MNAIWRVADRRAGHYSDEYSCNQQGNSPKTDHDGIFKGPEEGRRIEEKRFDRRARGKTFLYSRFAVPAWGAVQSPWTWKILRPQIVAAFCNYRPDRHHMDQQWEKYPEKTLIR